MIENYEKTHGTVQPAEIDIENENMNIEVN